MLVPWLGVSTPILSRLILEQCFGYLRLPKLGVGLFIQSVRQI